MGDIYKRIVCSKLNQGQFCFNFYVSFLILSIASFSYFSSAKLTLLVHTSLHMIAAAIQIPASTMKITYNTM